MFIMIRNHCLPGPLWNLSLGLASWLSLTLVRPVAAFSPITQSGEIPPAFLIWSVTITLIVLLGLVLLLTRTMLIRRRVEQALRESELKYKTVFEASTDAIFLESLAGQVLDCNTAACTMFGYTKAELLQLTVADLVPPELTSTLPDVVTQELTSGGIFIKAINITKDGRRFPVEVSTRLVTLEGQPRIIAYVRDISERECVSEALVRRAQELMALYETSLEINAQREVSTLLPAIVERAARLVGARMGGVYLIQPDGETLELVVSHNLPRDYTGIILRLGEGVSGRVAQTGAAITVEDHLHWEGRAAVFTDSPFRRVLGAPLKIGNCVIGVINVTDDLRAGAYSEEEVQLVSLFAQQAAIAIHNARLYETAQTELAERKRTEEGLAQERILLRTVIDNLPDAIYIKDTAMRKVLVNRADLANIGKSEAEVLGKTDWEMFPAEVAARFCADDQAVLESGQIIINREELLVNTNGQSCWLLTSKLPLRDNEGRITGIVGIGRDITERKQMEEALLESNRHLETALQELKATQEKIVQQERLAAVGQLAAGIAHDFNNILTSILGFAELLQMSPDTPPFVRADLAHIVASGQRAAHLVRQILDFSRKSIRRAQPLELVPFIKEVVKFLGRTIPENIQLELQIEPDAYLVEADPAQLQQMLTNLVVNARDAMPAGGTLRICLARSFLAGLVNCVDCNQPITGEWITLGVADTGGGISPEAFPHIFEPFFTTKAVGAGTGLGLAQVLGIVQQHAGHITVDSQVDQGTSFVVYLRPLPTTPKFIQPQEINSMQSGRGETILLVEDELDVLKTAQAMLQYLGYQVITAGNGREALAVYAKHRTKIALVLSDMVMPDMDGLALLNSLKAHNPAIKVVLMSGYPLDQEEARLLEQGVVDWFQKPLTLGLLARTINQALVELKQ